MKSPVSWIILTLYLCYLPISYVTAQNRTLLWTQTSAIWSSIRGVHGNLVEYAQQRMAGTRVRGESRKNADKIGIAYDDVGGRICWSDSSNHAIYCQPLQETLNLSLTSLQIVLNELVDVRDIDIDWETGNMYIALATSIAIAPSRGNKQNIYKYLLSADMKSVSGLAVDTLNNLLFWTDRQRGTIERSTLSGSKRMQLASSSDGQPLGIAAVPDQSRVYWVDKKLGVIQGCSYNGSDVKTYTSQRTPASSLYGIAIHSNIVFVTDTAELTLDVYSRDSQDTFNLEFSREIDAIPHHVTVVLPRKDNPTHECDNKPCQHICLNMGDHMGRCVCKIGHLLDADGISCTERNLQYAYTTGDDVMFATVVANQTNPSKLFLREKKLIGNRDNIRPLGFDYQEKTLFFGETTTGEILRGDPTSAKQVYAEHTVNTKEVQGIAVDWLASNVYWTDRALGLIMISHTDGRYHSVLIPRAGRPTGIAVDAKNRYLFWGDASGENKGIWSAHLDGSDTKIIADQRHTELPQGLFVDPHAERVYWVDKNRRIIQCMDYEGNNKREVFRGQDTYYDVTMFQDVSTWTDVNRGLTFTSSLSGEEYSVDGGRNRGAFDIIAYDPYLQPHENSRCLNNNGGCDQLCYLSGDNDNTCGCAIGFKLNSDGRSCDSENTKEYFVLYTDPYHKQVYQTSLLNNALDTQGIPGPLMDHPISVDYDTGKGRIFWIDLSKRSFKRTSETDESAEEIRAFESGSSPQRMVVDPVNGWVYYTDSGRRTVSKMMVDGTKHSDVFTDLDRPFGIALDYENQTLVWSTGTSIEVSNTDSTGRRTIEQGLVQAGGVAILSKAQIVYFSDNRTGTIYSFDLKSNQRSVVYEKNDFRIHSLAVSADYLYFSTFNEKGVYRINRTTGSARITLGKPVFARVTDIKVARGTVVPVYSEGGGFNWIILVGVLAGILLLLIILLAAILGTRKKRNANKARGTSTDREGSHGINDVDQSYAYVNQSHLFDIRGSHEAMNGNGHVNGHANGGLDTGFDPVNDSSVSEYVGIADIAAMDLARANGTNGSSVADIAAVAGVIAAAAPRKEFTSDEVNAIHRKYKPKRTFGRKKKTIPRNPDFEFAGGDKVATRIQRLANRLRNRLSSVRWSSGNKTDDEETADPAPDDPSNPEIVEPGVAGPLPKARIINGPPVLHQMPRGFAPASHCVPQRVKGK